MLCGDITSALQYGNPVANIVCLHRLWEQLLTGPIASGHFVHVSAEGNEGEVPDRQWASEHDLSPPYTTSRARCRALCVLGTWTGSHYLTVVFQTLESGTPKPKQTPCE